MRLFRSDLTSSAQAILARDQRKALGVLIINWEEGSRCSNQSENAKWGDGKRTCAISSEKMHFHFLIILNEHQGKRQQFTDSSGAEAPIPRLNNERKLLKATSHSSFIPL